MIHLADPGISSGYSLYASEDKAAHIARQRSVRIILADKAEGFLLDWTSANSSL